MANELTIRTPRGRDIRQAAQFVPNRGDSALLAPTSRWAVTKRLKLLTRLGPSAAVFCGEELIAVGGLVVAIPGVGECWMHVCRGVTDRRMGFKLARLCRRWLWSHADRLHRIATCVPGTDDRWVAWAHSLGLKFEAVLHGACADGSDSLMFAWSQNGT
jgi:hypothetical protein